MSHINFFLQNAFVGNLGDVLEHSGVDSGSLYGGVFAGIIVLAFVIIIVALIIRLVLFHVYSGIIFDTVCTFI